MAKIKTQYRRLPSPDVAGEGGGSPGSGIHFLLILSLVGQWQDVSSLRWPWTESHAWVKILLNQQKSGQVKFFPNRGSGIKILVNALIITYLQLNPHCDTDAHFFCSTFVGKKNQFRICFCFPKSFLRKKNEVRKHEICVFHVDVVCFKLKVSVRRWKKTLSKINKKSHLTQKKCVTVKISCWVIYRAITWRSWGKNDIWHGWLDSIWNF